MEAAFANKKWSQAGPDRRGDQTGMEVRSEDWHSGLRSHLAQHPPVPGDPIPWTRSYHCNNLSTHVGINLSFGGIIKVPRKPS